MISEDPDRIVEAAGVVGSFLLRSLVKIVHSAVKDNQDQGSIVLSLSTAARLLDLGESTLRACIQKGELKAYKVNGQYRIEKKALLEFEQQRKGN